MLHQKQFAKASLLLRWADRDGSTIQKCQNVVYFIQNQMLDIRKANDLLFHHVHQGLPHFRVRNYDVKAAVDLLSFGKIPSAHDVKLAEVSPELSDELKEHQNDMIRLKLARDSRAPRPLLKSCRISDGCVTFVVPNEFSVTLTIAGAERNSRWRISSLKFLVCLDSNACDIDIPENESILRDSMWKDLAQKHMYPDVPAVTLNHKKHSIDSALTRLYDILHIAALKCGLLLLEIHAFSLLASTWSSNDFTIGWITEKNSTALRITYWKNITVNYYNFLRCHSSLKQKNDQKMVENYMDFSLVEADTELRCDYYTERAGKLNAQYSRHKIILRTSAGFTLPSSNPELNLSALNLEKSLLYILRSHAKLVIQALRVCLINSAAASSMVVTDEQTAVGAIRIEEVGEISLNLDQEYTSCYFEVTLLPHHSVSISMDLRSGRVLIQNAVNQHYIPKELLKKAESDINRAPENLENILLDLRYSLVMADLEETAKTLDFVIKRNIPLLPQERIKIFQSTLEVEDEPVTIEKCAKILFLQFKRHRYAYLAIVIDHEGLHQSLIITNPSRGMLEIRSIFGLSSQVSCTNFDRYRLEVNSLIYADMVCRARLAYMLIEERLNEEGIPYGVEKYPPLPATAWLEDEMKVIERAVPPILIHPMNLTKMRFNSEAFFNKPVKITLHGWHQNNLPFQIKVNVTIDTQKLPPITSFLNQEDIQSSASQLTFILNDSRNWLKDLQSRWENLTRMLQLTRQVGNDWLTRHFMRIKNFDYVSLSIYFHRDFTVTIRWIKGIYQLFFDHESRANPFIRIAGFLERELNQRVNLRHLLLGLQDLIAVMLEIDVLERGSLLHQALSGTVSLAVIPRDAHYLRIYAFQNGRKHCVDLIYAKRRIRLRDVYHRAFNTTSNGEGDGCIAYFSDLPTSHQFCERVLSEMPEGDGELLALENGIIGKGPLAALAVHVLFGELTRIVNVS